MARLSEENTLLENQLELLSEKMYGSPAKSAARERDRLQIEVERERGSRLAAEEMSHALRAQLAACNAKIAELTAELANEEGARADLERTRRALHAARANAALDLTTREQARARHLYNPIAAPRHQFGTLGGGGRAATPTSAGTLGRASGGGRTTSTPRTRVR